MNAPTKKHHLKPQKRDPAKLRAVAETRLKTAKATTAKLPADALVKELSVHRIELEMQNETVRATLVALEKSRDHYADFYDFAPVGYLTLSRSGDIISINLTGAALLGVDRAKLLRRRFASVVVAEDVPRWQAHFADVLKSVEKSECELTLRQAEGHIQIQLDSLCVVKHGQPTTVRIAMSDITRRKAAEFALKESEYRWKFAVEGTGDGLWDWNVEDSTVLYSERCKEILGFGDETGGNYGSTWEQRIHPEDRPNTLAVLNDYFDGKLPNYASEYRLMDSRGNYRWLLDRGVVVSRNRQGKPLRMIGTLSNIAERKHAEEHLRIAAVAFESQEGMFVTDAAQVILRVNRAFSEISGYSAAEAIGKTPELFRSSRHDDTFYADMRAALEHSGTWQGETNNRRKGGEMYPAWLTVTAVKDAGKVVNYVFTVTDISLRKAAEDEIQYLAFYDPLTGLPNRRLLYDRVRRALATSARSGHGGAILFIDLDNFKTLNDTVGHDIGDLLLQQVAERLVSCIREGDTAARLGGDEFVVMLENLSENTQEAATQTETIGEQVLGALNEPYILAGIEHRSTPSIGVTLFSSHNQTVEELLKRADLAMYQAKTAGRNALRFFDPDMQAVVTTRAALETDLRLAIKKHQFVLHYQVQMDRDGGTGEQHLTGAEALLRWQQPQHGTVMPDAFIPLAEETGIILALGAWVIEAACTQLAIWAATATEPLSRLTLAVNVSARCFHQPDFAESLVETIARTGANPSLLKIELTESVLISNVEDVIAKMTILKKIGVGFSLDDFGTGYSSLYYLKRLPLDQLKIDQGFVNDILTNPNDAAIAKTIVALADSLGLTVIAEGVESEAQKDFLSRQGCHAYQGYLFGRPLPLAEFEDFVQHA